MEITDTNTPQEEIYNLYKYIRNKHVTDIISLINFFEFFS